jgi:hypothetical protein
MNKLAKILSVIALLSGVLFSSSALAAKAQLVIFCSSWNMKCRDAGKIAAAAANDLNLKLMQIDMDDASLADKASDMEIKVPSSVPYIYVLNSKGNVVFEELYKGEPLQDLEQRIKAKL